MIYYCLKNKNEYLGSDNTYHASIQYAHWWLHEEDAREHNNKLEIVRIEIKKVKYKLVYLRGDRTLVHLDKDGYFPTKKEAEIVRDFLSHWFGCEFTVEEV